MMSEDELRGIVAGQIRGALGFDHDQLSSRRADNLARYEGEFYGDEREGRSKVMSRDVMETVEAVMPSLVRTFLGTDQVVQFEPNGPEDDDYAEQATDYVNYILMADNDGVRIGYDWMKSALISGTSVVKLWWDETEKTKEEEYNCLDDQQFMDLVSDDSIEVIEHTAYGVVNGQPVERDVAVIAPQMGVGVGVTHDVKVKKTFTKARLRWEALAPEEFLVNRRARTLDEDDETFYFCAHRTARSIDALKAEGYDEDLLERIATEYEELYLAEEQERFDDLEYSSEFREVGHKRVWVYECYMRLDYDEDGAAELRKMTVIGGGVNTEILDNEVVEELPFADLSAVRLPHRFNGWSLSELVKDIQRLKTTLWRAMMDGLYQSLFPHKAVDQNKVELDDLLSEEPGSLFRTNGSPHDAILPIATQWNGVQGFSMIEYIDRVLISRSGVNDLAGGLDANALQGETARGVEEAASAAKARIELMARMMAETGWKRLCKLALKMVNRYQDKQRVVRLRGEWVNVDPRSWNVDMDVRVNVGLGVGSKAEQIAKLNAVLNEQKEILVQMGPDNPLSPLDKFYNTLTKLTEAADLEPGLHFDDPTEWLEQKRAQPPAPNPEMLKHQTELQMKQAEMQAKAEQSQRDAAMRAETEREKAAMAAEIERFKAELDAQIQRQKAEMQVAVDRERLAQEQAVSLERMQREFEHKMAELQAENQYKTAELQAEKELEAAKMAARSRDGQGNINLSD